MNLIRMIQILTKLFIDGFGVMVSLMLIIRME